MKKIAVIFTALLALCIAAMPVQSREAAKNALILCSDVLIPSIFPFLVCSNILVSLGAADKISKYAGKITRPLFFGRRERRSADCFRIFKRISVRSRHGLQSL